MYKKIIYLVATFVFMLSFSACAPSSVYGETKSTVEIRDITELKSPYKAIVTVIKDRAAFESVSENKAYYSFDPENWKNVLYKKNNSIIGVDDTGINFQNGNKIKYGSCVKISISVPVAASHSVWTSQEMQFYLEDIPCP